jgi:hypothetical protein
LASATLSSSIALTSTEEHPLDVPRDRLAGRLRRADLIADHRGVVCYKGIRVRSRDGQIVLSGIAATQHFGRALGRCGAP